MRYLPKRRSRFWIVPVSSLLGRLPLIPANDTGSIPHSMQGSMDTCYPGDECDNLVKSGTGSALFYINCWTIIFPSDQPVDWKSKHKLITGISTVKIELKVQYDTELECLQSICNPIQANNCSYIPTKFNTWYVQQYLITIWASRFRSTCIALSTCHYLHNTYQ